VVGGQIERAEGLGKWVWESFATKGRQGFLSFAIYVAEPLYFIRNDTERDRGTLSISTGLSRLSFLLPRLILSMRVLFEN
jgi:hypothetical protein